MQKSCLYDNYIDEKVIICTNTKKITEKEGMIYTPIDLKEIEKFKKIYET